MILWGFVHHTQMFFVEAYIPGMDEEAFLFTGRGREGQGPKSKGVGKGSKSAGQGGTRQGTYYVYQADIISWLKSYAKAKEILIRIALATKVSHKV